MLKNYFICSSQEKARFQELFVGKHVPLPYFLLQVSVQKFIPYNMYFCIEKRMYLKFTPVK